MCNCNALGCTASCAAGCAPSCIIGCLASLLTGAAAVTTVMALTGTASGASTIIIGTKT